MFVEDCEEKYFWMEGWKIWCLLRFFFEGVVVYVNILRNKKRGIFCKLRFCLVCYMVNVIEVWWFIMEIFLISWLCFINKW